MSALWTQESATAATGGTVAGIWQASGVSIDSRSVAPGDLFIAIKGPNADGHDYVPDALAKGAAAAMVSERRQDWPADAPLLIVTDTDAALTALGTAARTRLSKDARVIGVTGSVGKTGTKEALRHALSRQGPTSATEGNLNNQWGAPLSLARMPAETRYGIFELGMNHAGEIHALSEIVKPDIAVITTVEGTHAEFFDTVEAIADAKAEIFDGMSRNGVAILNRDNPHFERLRRHAEEKHLSRIISFGAHPDATVQLTEYSLHASSSAVEAKIGGNTLEYSLGAPGLHWILNSLAVLAAVKAAGADLCDAARSLADIRALKGRGERHKVAYAGGSFTLIDESYNASPASVRAALSVLGQSKPADGGRRIAVLGDMLELGADARAEHAALADAVIAAEVDIVLTAGENMAALSDALPGSVIARHGENSDAILPVVLSTVRPGDVITVKGSLGSRMAPITAALLALDGTEDPLDRPAVNGG